MRQPLRLRSYGSPALPPVPLALAWAQDPLLQGHWVVVQVAQIRNVPQSVLRNGVVTEVDFRQCAARGVWVGDWRELRERDTCVNTYIIGNAGKNGTA